MPKPYVINEPPFGASTVHQVIARNADGLDSIEIRLRFDTRIGPAKALRLFARAALEVVVHARAPKEPTDV